MQQLRARQLRLLLPSLVLLLLLLLLPSLLPLLPLPLLLALLQAGGRLQRGGR